MILGDLACVLPPTIYVLNGIATLRDQIKEIKLKVIVLWERFIESELLYTFLFPFLIVLKPRQGRTGGLSWEVIPAMERQKWREEQFSPGYPKMHAKLITCGSAVVI